MTITIDAALARQKNALDYVRLAAAILVIASHSYPLLGRSDEVFSRYLKYDSGGGIAVAAFFVISGFLIARSAVENDGRSFLIARFLRLAPGLIFVTTCQYLIIGPIFTTLPLMDFFYVERWHIVKTIVLYNSNFHLAGTFHDHPVSAVNGSLWTLNYEWGFYLILFMFVSFRIITKNNIAIIILAILSALVYLKTGLGLDYTNQGGNIFNNTLLFSGIKFLTSFLVGSLFYFHRKNIPLSWPLAIACGITLVISYNSHFSSFAFHIAFSYLVIFFGLYFQPRFDLKARIGDLSYGVYLFGFPIQQSWIALIPQGLTPTKLTLLATATCLACAWISWHYVERPALRLRHRWRGVAERAA